MRQAVSDLAVEYLLHQLNAGIKSIPCVRLEAFLTEMKVRDAHRQVKILLRNKVIMPLSNKRISLNIVKLRRRKK